MIGQRSSHRRRSTNPAPLLASLSDNHQRHRQTPMVRAEVVDRTGQVHALFQQSRRAGQCPRASGQRRDHAPERRVKTLDVGRVQHPASLALDKQGLGLTMDRLRRRRPREGRRPRVWNQPSLDLIEPMPLALFDDLTEDHAGPSRQPRAPAFAGSIGRPEGLAKGIDVGNKAIKDDQNGPTKRGPSSCPVSKRPRRRATGAS
jgi:hypothetical protein